MRSHLPLLGARSAAATVQLQGMSPGGWLMTGTEQKDKKQMRLWCAGTETGTELPGHRTELLLLQYDIILWITKFIFTAAPSRATQEWEEMMEGTASSGQSSWETTWISKSLQNILLYYISLGLFRVKNGFTTQPHSKISGLYNSWELLHYLPRRYISSHLSYQWRKKCTEQ